MNVAQGKVRRFHEKHELPRAYHPTLVSRTVQEQRWGFIYEELAEYEAANKAGNIVAVADALGDLLYVVLGTAVVHGIQMDEVFDEIHRSNMTKHNLNKQGKGGKGEGYEPPQLGDLL